MTPHRYSAKTTMALSVRTKLPRLCVSRSMARVRVRSPSLRSKHFCTSIQTEQKVEILGNGSQSFASDGCGNNGNKVMVVVDADLEANSPLEWALSHTVQNQDTIILLYVAKPSPAGPTSNLKVNLRVHELLCTLKQMCQKRRPGVQVEVTVREGKEKGPIIVEEAKQQRVSMLVLGQRKRGSIMLRLLRRWRGKRSGGGAAEYCIQNASCMTIAVRRKGRKVGGYLITTKRHKNFWLLA